MVSKPDLNTLIAKTYAAALDHEQWRPLLDFATDLFGGVGTSFEVLDKKTGNPLLVELGSGLSRVSARDYLEYYGRISPRVRHAKSVRSGEVTYDYAILSEADIDADEFYSDCIAPVGLRYFVAGHVLDANGHLGALAVQRSARQGHIGEAETALMQRLLPHMQQAIDLKYRFLGAELRSIGFLECLEQLGEAVILVDKTSDVLHANKAAEELIKANDGILLEGGRIGFLHKPAKRNLDGALAAALGIDGTNDKSAGTSFIAHRPSGCRAYLVSVRRLPTSWEVSTIADHCGAALVFIRDPDTFDRLNTDLLSASYGLSVAETQIATALDQGHSIKEIARMRGVAPTTVRSQLYSLMAKLSVSRQVDLVQLLARYRRPFS